MIANGVCKVVGCYQRLQFNPLRRKPMRLESQEESRVIVTVKAAKRDDRKTVVEETVDGKKKEVPNKMYGKIVYETVESIDVYEAPGEQVVAAVRDGLKRAAQNGAKQAPRPAA
jgi:hypothetical protein